MGMRIGWLTAFLDFPARDAGRGAAFWSEVTGTSLSPWRGPAGEFATLTPPDGDACLRIQRIRAGPGGCHLDVHVDPRSGSLARAADEARALGARILDASAGLITAVSPGGFAFCLVPYQGEATIPAARDFGADGTSRADQLCLDIAPSAYDSECRFWAFLTGWPHRPGVRPEFSYLERPRHVPVRLLLQRRDDAGPGERVTAHIDVACTAPRNLAARHIARGAAETGRFPHWIAMTDPTGRSYCLTMRDPATGKLGGATGKPGAIADLLRP